MDNTIPVVSVIVPVYNIQEYIGKCLDSIIKQSYTNIEIIVVDDGSTDGSGKICDEYAALDNRIRVAHVENRGLVAARKLGIQLSSGDYVGFVDGDDYIEQDMYENLAENIFRTGADFVHGGFVEENDGISKIVSGVSDEIYRLSTYNEKIKFLNKFLFETKPDEFVSPSIWSKLFKKELIEKTYYLVPDKNSYGEDILCLVLSCIYADSVSLCRKNNYHYVRRKGSMTDLESVDYLSKEVNFYRDLLKITMKYFHSESLNKRLMSFYKNRVFDAVEKLSGNLFRIPRFFWKDMDMLFGKKIILYGAGNVGLDYYLQICRYSRCNIVSWVDKNALSLTYKFRKIESVDVVLEIEFDIILIAIKDEKIANDVINDLEGQGIKRNRVIWSKPGNVAGST